MWPNWLTKKYALCGVDYYHLSFKSMGQFLKKLRSNALLKSEMQRFKLNSINKKQFGTNKAK